MKRKKDTKSNNKIRMIAFIIISIFAIATMTLFWINAYIKGDIAGGILGLLIAASIIIFTIFVLKKGNKDMREGYPLEDERSKRVKEKASSRAFYVSLYLLLVVGLLSVDVIKFRDVSQATSAIVGGMAILFAAFWIFYNRKEI
jgi:uncharacterized membrane protein